MINAKFYRNLVCAGLGALALGYVPLSHAFYAQATPPVGFVAGAINTFNGAKAGATASIELGRIAANASLNVGGRAIALASRTSLAANAARVAALAIYAHPAVRVGVGIAAWIGLTAYLYNTTKGVWEQPDPAVQSSISDGWQYYIYGQSQRYGTAAQLCALQGGTPYNKHQAGYWQGCESSGNRWTIWAEKSACPVGWYQTGAGCVQSPPMQTVPQEQFVEELTRHPFNPNIVPELPFDLPVEVPYIEPIFVPTGNPVKNPAYDPAKPQTGENQPYLQPGVKIDPANDAKNPFQVNVQPTNRPTSSPTGSTESQPITSGTGTETDGTSDQPKEDEDTRDLCEKNPDILACQKVDTDVENEEIPKAQKTVSYQSENIWGFGACPADQYARVGGQQMKVVDWSRDCGFVVDYVRPVVLVLSALAVAGILVGALKQ